MEYCLLHGLGQSPADWAAVEAGLPGQKILCPDLAAWWADRPVTDESLLEGLEAQCAGREEAMVLCGCSLGAILALDYAWRHPRQVSALVLIAPRVRMPRGLLRLQNGVFRLLPARAFAGQGMGKDQVLSLTRSMLALDLTPALDAVCQPTLVLCGEKDRVNQSAAREIARRLMETFTGLKVKELAWFENPREKTLKNGKPRVRRAKWLPEREVDLVYLYADHYLDARNPIPAETDFFIVTRMDAWGVSTWFMCTPEAAEKLIAMNYDNLAVKETTIVG